MTDIYDSIRAYVRAEVERKPGAERPAFDGFDSRCLVEAIHWADGIERGLECATFMKDSDREVCAGYQSARLAMQGVLNGRFGDKVAGDLIDQYAGIQYARAEMTRTLSLGSLLIGGAK